MPTELLRLSQIGSSDHSLRDISFCLYEGEFLEIVEFSNSRKYMLARLLSGEETPSRGTIYFQGVPLTPSPGSLREHGIFVISQRQEQLTNLSVIDSIFAIGCYKKTSFFYHPARYRKLVDALLEEFDYQLDIYKKLGQLTPFQQCVTKILRAVILGAHLIVIEEPFPFLNASEESAFHKILEALIVRDISIIHLVPSIERMTDLSKRCYFLYHGRIAMELTPQEMRGYIAGQSFDFQQLRSSDASAPAAVPVLSARELSCVPLLLPVDIDIYPGDCLGVVDRNGLSGYMLAHILSGNAPYNGRLSFEGRPILLRSTSDAHALGISFIHDDIYENGLIGNLSDVDNVTLGCYTRIHTASFINRNKQRYLAQKGTERIKAYFHDFDQGDSRAVLAMMLTKALLERPKVLIMLHTFQFLGDNDKLALQRVIASLREQGTAVVVISNDMKCLDPIVNRVIIMESGRVAHTLQ